MQPTIKPFCATYYNPEKIKDLSSVVCPPYDVIDSEKLSILKKLSEYNFSHVLLANGDNYSSIGKKFRQWFKDNIFTVDDKESLYLYEQTFSYDGKQYSRYGITAILKMDKKGSVFPHEHTLTAPKKDRKKMIGEMKANLSPVFIIIPKPMKVLHKVYCSYSGKKPFSKFKDADGNSNCLWKIEDKNEIKRICCEIDKHKFVIADGHHRFEVAYDYYLKNKGRFKNLNYVLAHIVDAQKGLLILPTHRIVELKEDIPSFPDKLKKYFHIEDSDAVALKEKLQEEGNFRMGIYRAGKYHFLQLKKFEIIDKIITDPVYKKLDTCILHQFVFPLLDIKNGIEYTHSIQEAEKLAGKNKTVFLLRPVSLKAVFSVANKGYRLPQKSTYFYPKVSCGIVLRKFEPAK